MALRNQRVVPLGKKSACRSCGEDWRCADGPRGGRGVLSGLNAKAMLPAWRRTIAFSPKRFGAGWATSVGTGKRD